jgi:hypothetical protein
MMNTQFADLIATGMVQVYIDDILIATADDPTVHRPMVCKVLDRLQEMDMYLKPSKCYFEVHKIEFLGMILENGTVTMDPVKVAGVTEWKEPKNVKDIHKFLGFCNFYRRFIRGFLQIAKPLNNLLKKGVKWAWEEAEQEAFDKLKKQVTEEPGTHATRPEETVRNRSRHIKLRHWCRTYAERRKRNPTPSGLLFKDHERRAKELQRV